MVVAAACDGGTDDAVEESVPASMAAVDAVTVAEDVVYAAGTQRDGRPVEWTLDLYRSGDAGDAPRVVFLHGGGESKNTFASLARGLAEHGLAVYLIDYPDASPELAIAHNNADGFRAMADAAACAIRFARGSGDGDGALVVLGGFSRGAGLASHAALAGEDLGRLWEDYGESGGGPQGRMDCAVTDASTSVDALIGVAGPYDAFVGLEGDHPYGRAFMQEHEPDLWPVLHGVVGTETDLEVRLLHGELDGVVPVEESADLAALLTDAGYHVELTLFTGRHNVPVELTVETVMDLLAE